MEKVFANIGLFVIGLIAAPFVMCGFVLLGVVQIVRFLLERTQIVSQKILGKIETSLQKVLK